MLLDVDVCVVGTVPLVLLYVMEINAESSALMQVEFPSLTSRETAWAQPAEEQMWRSHELPSFGSVWNRFNQLDEHSEKGQWPRCERQLLGSSLAPSLHQVSWICTSSFYIIPLLDKWSAPNHKPPGELWQWTFCLVSIVYLLEILYMYQIFTIWDI